MLKHRKQQIVTKLRFITVTIRLTVLIEKYMCAHTQRLRELCNSPTQLIDF